MGGYPSFACPPDARSRQNCRVLSPWRERVEEVNEVMTALEKGEVARSVVVMLKDRFYRFV